MEWSKVVEHCDNLYSTTPMVGGWKRAMAAKGLAEFAIAGSELATKTLAEAVDKHPDPFVRELACASLRQLRSESCVDVFCEFWQRNPSAVLDDILITSNYIASKPLSLRILTALKVGQVEVIETASREVIQPLLDAAESRDQVVAARARQTLARLRSQEALDAFCAHWVENPSPLLDSILTEADYVASGPARARVLTALKVGRIEAIAAMGSEAVRPLIEAIHSFDPVVATRAREFLSRLDGSGIIDLFCDEVMVEDGDDLAQIARQAGYAPSDEAKRALFYFLMEQWEKYDVLDFQEDRPLLRRVYALASPKVQSKVLEVARRAGRTANLSQVVVGQGKHLRAAQMGDAEWEAVVNGLRGERRWEEMWRLVFVAPVEWAAEMVKSIREDVFRDDIAERDSQLWAEVVALCPEEGRRVRLLDVAPLQTLEGHTGPVKLLAISPDGSILASASWDSTVRLWRWPDGQPLRTLDELTSYPRTLAMVADGTDLVAVDGNGNVRQWRLRSGEPLKWFNCGSGWSGSSVCIGAAPGGAVLASNPWNKTVRLWHLSSGKMLKTLEGHAGNVLCLASTSDGSILVTGSADKTARLWHLPSGEPITTLEGHLDEVTCLAIGPDGSLLASVTSPGVNIYHDRKAEVRLWRLPSGDLLKTLETDQIGGLISIAPDGSTLAHAGGDGTIHLWSLPSGELVNKFRGHLMAVKDLAFSSNGAVLASASCDCAVGLWRLPAGQPIEMLRGHSRIVNCLAMASDGSILASGSDDGTVRLWQLRWTKPLADARFDDLEHVRLALRERQLSKEERRGWEFLDALLRGKFRYDITVEETKVISVGDFDIEIEG